MSDLERFLKSRFCPYQFLTLFHKNKLSKSTKNKLKKLKKTAKNLFFLTLENIFLWSVKNSQKKNNKYSYLIFVKKGLEFKKKE